MQPSTLLAYVVATLGLTSAATIPTTSDVSEAPDAVLSKRACFKTGENFGDEKGFAQAYIRKACRDHFEHYYLKDEVKTACYNIPHHSNRKHVKFSVGLKGHNAGNARYLGEDECYDGLRKEVSNCGKGGETTYGNWMYRADPNKGPC